MGWKKKEKPLTPDEAIAQAKKDLAPFWFGSEPLLAAVSTENGASVLPLNPAFIQTPWLFSFIDPTEFAGERAIMMVREWHRRYAGHKLGFVIVFRAPEGFVKSAADLLRKFQVQFPAMYDQENLFSQAFGIQSFPGVVVQSWGAGAQPEEIARGAGANWIEGVEVGIQKYLRRSDPGLSLSLPFSLPHAVVGQSRVDFGTVKGQPIASLSQVIELQGNWKETESSITTSDPAAVAIVHSASPIFSLIAQPSIEAQVTKIFVEPAEGALMQEWIPDGISVDENGRGVARIQHFGLYDMLKDLPAGRRHVRLSFPDADTVPVQIYGLRFGSAQ